MVSFVYFLGFALPGVVCSYLVCHTRGGSEEHRCIRHTAEVGATSRQPTALITNHHQKLYIPAAADTHPHNAAAAVADPAGIRRHTAAAGERHSRRRRIVVVVCSKESARFGRECKPRAYDW